MMRYRIASAVAAAAFAAVPAIGVANPFPGLPAQAVPVGDAVLAGARGMYVPPPNLAAALPRPPAQRLEEPLAYRAAAGHHALAGLTVAPLHGPIVYFGISMSSRWTVGSGDGVAVGTNIGIDVATRTLSISNWSSVSGAGLPSPAPGTSSISGAPPVGSTSSGVGQSIQVAGNGNSIINEAYVEYGTASVPLPSSANANGCGSVCAAYANATGAGVTITAPQGVVAQSIGANGILQTAQIWSDFNAVTNQMAINVQAGRSTSAGITGLTSMQIGQLLPSVTGL